DKRLKQHIPRTSAQSGSAGRGVQTRFHECFTCLYAASNAFAKVAFGFERDEGGSGFCFVQLLYRRLSCTKPFRVHIEMP
ncbi:MAG: hypothetical protein WAK19_09920, partial [Candidatus Cybelea sp.]